LTAGTIRVLLADDQAMVRGALVVLLNLESDIQVVSEVARGDEVLAAARQSNPDVALLDVEMPGRDGIAAAAELRDELPAIRVLILTTFGRPGYLRRAMQAGASGYMVKDTPARQLADAVRRVASGLRVIDPELAAESLANGDSPLSERETDVLSVARIGGTIADIARSLNLSEGTVRNYLSSAIGKTEARTRAQAVRIAESNGWLLN
jgi:two-component system response regulator DesR